MLVVLVSSITLPMALVRVGTFLFSSFWTWVFVLGTYDIFDSGGALWRFMYVNNDWLSFAAVWLVLGLVLCLTVLAVSRSSLSSRNGSIIVLGLLIVQVVLPISSVLIWNGPFFDVDYAIPFPMPTVVALIGLRFMRNNQTSK
jgi:hypothetical protein